MLSRELNRLLFGVVMANFGIALLEFLTWHPFLAIFNTVTGVMALACQLLQEVTRPD